MTEKCPRCGEASSVRPKVLLIDEAWVQKDGVDSRLKYMAYLRVDDLKAEGVRPEPLSQFVDGYFCDACGMGFVGDAALAEHHRRYR